jgi:hypothetical protein
MATELEDTATGILMATVLGHTATAQSDGYRVTGHTHNTI